MKKHKHNFGHDALLSGVTLKSLMANCEQTVLMVFQSCYSRNDSVILHSNQENIVSLAVLNCIDK